MAGLCKPYAARRLVEALRQEVGLPVHFHTHDIGGAQAASVLQGSDAGLDVADGAIASMSGLTSQPSLNALVESLRFTPRETGLDPNVLIALSRYWEQVRALYKPFESGLQSSSAEVYAYGDAGRAVLEPVPAGQGPGPRLALGQFCEAYAR
jgi:pyruvate carboxylase